MITIKKNWKWFLVSWKNIKWSAEICEAKSDFCTHSNEKDWEKCKSGMCFDWPWEYEKNEAEIRWVELNDNWVTAFNVVIDDTKIAVIAENIEDINENFLDNLWECDILLLSIWNKTNLKILKDLIEKIEARITVFWWDNSDALLDKFPKYEKLEEIKVSNLPVDTSLYYVVI